MILLPAWQHSGMDYGMGIRLDADFDRTVAATRAALAEQGFGVITEIDVRSTLKTKIDRDIEDYLILGACNPSLAARALDHDRRIGLLLPCNVVVRRGAHDEDTIVEALDPAIMVQVPGADAMAEVADEARGRLRDALDRIIELTAAP